jgi:hypothetical protein
MGVLDQTTLADQVGRLRALLSGVEKIDVVAFYPALVPICDGSHNAALLLCQALYWTPRGDADGWFYKTTADWEKELHLKKTAFENARDVLQARGFWTWKVKRAPPRCHYQVNIPAIEEAFCLIIPNAQIELHETGKLNCTRSANQTAQQGKNDWSETGKTHKEAENTTESTSEITSGDVAFIQEALAPFGTPASRYQAEKLIQECRASVPDITPEEIGYFIRQKGGTAKNADSPMGVILRTVPRDCVTPATVSDLRSRRAKDKLSENEKAQREAQDYSELKRELEMPRLELLKRRLDDARQALAASPDASQRRLLPGMIRDWERELRELEGKGTSEGVPVASNARGGRSR